MSQVPYRLRYTARLTSLIILIIVIIIMILPILLLKIIIINFLEKGLRKYITQELVVEIIKIDLSQCHINMKRYAFFFRHYNINYWHYTTCTFFSS